MPDEKAPSSGAFLPASLMYFCSGKPMQFYSGVDTLEVLMLPHLSHDLTHRPRRCARGYDPHAQPLQPQSPAMRALAQLVAHRRRLVGDTVRGTPHSASRCRPLPTAIPLWRNAPRTIPTSLCLTPCQGPGPCVLPASSSPSAHHGNASPRPKSSNNTRALRRSRNAVASSPGCTGASRVRRACATRAGSGRRHPRGMPSGPKSLLSSNATKTRRTRRPCAP